MTCDKCGLSHTGTGICDTYIAFPNLNQPQCCSRCYHNHQYANGIMCHCTCHDSHTFSTGTTISHMSMASKQ